LEDYPQVKVGTSKIKKYTPFVVFNTARLRTEKLKSYITALKAGMTAVGMLFGQIEIYPTI